MNPIVQTRLDDLRRLCAKHRVERLELFGSAAGGDFDPAASDLDFVVEFQPMPPTNHADAFFGLLEDLERLFDRRIDLLEDGAIDNPYLRSAILQSSRVLYAAA